MIMRGRFTDQGGLFSYIAPDKRVPANHQLRKVRKLVRDVLSDLNRSLGRLYASEGRPSIPPAQLLSALLLHVFYGIGSESQFDGLQPFVSLVRGTAAGRSGLGSDHLHQEPGAAAARRCVHEVHAQASEPSAGQAVAVGRALLDGRKVDRSLGFEDGSGDDDDGANFHGQKRKNDTHGGRAAESAVPKSSRTLASYITLRIPKAAMIAAVVLGSGG
jgi:hypothetical protein